MGKLEDRDVEAICAKRRAGWSQARIATWLERTRGVRISQQAISLALRRELDEGRPRRARGSGPARSSSPSSPSSPTATSTSIARSGATSKGSRDPQEILERLRRRARRLSKYQHAATQLRSIEIEIKIVERQLRILDAQATGVTEEIVGGLADLLSLSPDFDRSAQEAEHVAFAQAPATWLARAVPRLLPDLDRVIAALDRVAGRELEAATLRNARSAINAAILLQGGNP